MRLFFYNNLALVITLFILNSMIVSTKNHRKQDSMYDSKRSVGSDIEDMHKKFKLSYKIKEDPSEYYESVSNNGHGRNDSALIVNNSFNNESTTDVKDILGIVNVSATENIVTLASINYDSLMQELNKKIKNLTVPLTSLTTVRNEGTHITVSPGDEKLENITATENLIPNTHRSSSLYNIPSTIQQSMSTTDIPYYVTNPGKKSTLRNDILLTNISNILAKQKEIIKQLLVNIDKAQKSLNVVYDTDTDSLESTTKFILHDGSEALSSNHTSNAGFINDLSTFILKLAEVENNVPEYIADDKKQKSKNPFTTFLQKILKTNKNFADGAEI